MNNNRRPVRLTTRAHLILAAVMVGALIMAVRPFAHLILIVGQWWNVTALPALTLAAPVGIPVLLGALLFCAVVRVDTRR